MYVYRESARSTESTDMILNKSPFRTIASSEFQAAHNISTIANSSAIKKYLQHSATVLQLKELNRSQANINTSQMHPYQQGQHDLDEHRLIIQEEDEQQERSVSFEQSNHEMEENVPKLVILGSGKDHAHTFAGGCKNTHTTSNCETLDLSKGRESKDRGGIENSDNKNCVLDREALALSATTAMSKLSTLTRLSSNNSTITKNITVPSISTVGTGSIMTILPHSQETAAAGTIPIPISNNAPESSATIQSPISSHINLKGRPLEGKLILFNNAIATVEERVNYSRITLIIIIYSTLSIY